MIQHAPEVKTTLTKDGDIDAKVYRIRDTGVAGTVTQLVHNMGHIPVGCIVQLSNKECQVYRGSVWNSTTVEMKFTADNADVNIRIW